MMALRLAGAKTVEVPAREGRVDLRRLLGSLYSMGIGTILCEGGSVLGGALWTEGLVDRLLTVVSPAVLGGKRSLPLMLLPDVPLGHCRRVEFEEVRRVGSDVMLFARTVFRKGRSYVFRNSRGHGED